MGTIRRFEDILAWQKSRKLVKSIYAVSNQRDFIKDYPLRNQIRRAAISIPSNIAEGFGRGGNKEFLNFLSIARASSSELQSHLYLAVDQNYLTEREFERLSELTWETGSLINGLMKYLQKTEIRGSKFR
jgi:four helix bundle protein